MKHIKKKSPTRKRTRRQPNLVRTIAAAASRLGYSQQHVKGIRDAGAPGFMANGTIDVSAVKAWMLANPTKLPAPSNWRDALGLQKLRAEKRNNDKADRLLVERAWVADQFQQLFRPVLARVEHMLLNEYPSKVTGLDAPAVRIYAKKVFDQILEAHREAALRWQV